MDENNASAATVLRAQLAGMAALASVALITTDQRKRIAFFNRGAERLFGYTGQEILGEPIGALFPELAGEHIHPEPWALVPSPIVCARKGGATFIAAAEIVRPDAEDLSLTIVVRQDHAAQEAMEGPIGQSALLHAVQDAVIVTDPGFRITGWNPAAEELYGWPAAEAIGKSVSPLLRTEHLDTEQAQVLRHFWSQGFWKGEVRQHHRDGRAIAILATTALVRGPAGDPVGVISVNRDISERKRAETQLRAHAARLELLTEASRAFAELSLNYEALLEQVVHHIAETMRIACIITLLSPDARTLQPVALHDVDPEALAFMRALFPARPIPADSTHPVAQVFRSGQTLLIPTVDPEQLRATLPPEFWGALDRFRVNSLALAPLQVQGQTIGVLGLIQRVSGQPGFTDDDLQLIQNLADRAALAIANARLYQQVQRELAERRHAEQILEAERAALARRVAERTADLSLLNAELTRAARLKDEFLANMSHELRTPLNAVLGRSQALQEEIYGPVTPEQVKALHGIVESGQHLLTLINDILDLSKIETGKLQLEHTSVDVDLLCAMSLRMVAETAVMKRLTLTSRLDGQVQQLYADERRLRQILVNLLANAVKFTPSGGEVGLEIRSDSEHGTVTFTVWDTGIGIAPEDLPKLFQPFVQLDSSLNRQYTGTGLGLALVLRLAEAHGGSVAVESAPGRGSRFSVSVPWKLAEQTGKRRADTAGQPLVQSAPAIAPSQRRPRILLAEDNEANITAFSDYLIVKGYDLLVAHNGGEALALALAERPDLILMDIQMPGMDGLEATRRIRAEDGLAATPIIALTALAMPGDRERCLAAGANLYLAKPVSLRALVAAIEAQRQHTEQVGAHKPQR